MSEFWKKYRDPRWQKVRLEKMQEAGFACEHCHATDITLNVHHKIYRRGADPWAYELVDLACLCEPCHEEFHELNDMFKETIAKLDHYAFEQVVGYARAVLAQIDCQPEIETRSPMFVDGISAAFGYSDDTEILEIAKSNGGKLPTDLLWALQRSRRERQQS